MSEPSRKDRLFTRLIAWRVPIVIIYAVLVPAAAYLASRLPSEGAIDRLLVPSDPAYVETRAFQKIFPEGKVAILLFEAAEPWSAAVLRELDAASVELRAIPNLSTYGVLDIYRRARGGLVLDPAGVSALATFARGSTLLAKQGLVGEHFLGLALALRVSEPEQLAAMLAQIDAALARTPRHAVTAVRKVGAPYIEAWIAREASHASFYYFPILGALVVAVALFLYRSWRTLIAVLLAMASAVALGMGAGALLGFTVTIVSALVPLTIMVTTLASVVYVHSRFVDQPEGTSVDAHQIFALGNKLLPVSASTFAAVLGFAALAVSQIRPIREMGLWTATGLALGWLVTFTLFPALQKLLATPTGRVVPLRTALYDRVAAALPHLTWRWRWPLVLTSTLVMFGGVAALFGVPGHLAPMRVGINAVDYVDPKLDIHRDLVWFRDHVSGLDVVRVWVRTREGQIIEPAVLRGLDRLATRIDSIAGVSTVVGPTAMLRMRRYVAGFGETLPEDPQAFARLAADLEQLLLTEPELRGFFDVGTLGNAQLTVLFNQDLEDYASLERALELAWHESVSTDPAFADASMRVVGESMLAAKVGASMVPTLTYSFALTAALIFVAFLFVFRSPSARLMAIIPSLFAILATFLGMRLLGASLNVATILIATTVLGTTENDQIHFFYHLQEAKSRDLGAGLRHTLHISGRAIVFATLINAIGFLGLAVSSFPPLRQFGIITSAAFLLAMLADFTALPASMWILRRARPKDVVAG